MSNQFLNIIINSITGITLAVFTQYVSNLVFQIKTQDEHIQHVNTTVHTIENILCDLQKRIHDVEITLGEINKPSHNNPNGLSQIYLSDTDEPQKIPTTFNPDEYEFVDK